MACLKNRDREQLGEEQGGNSLSQQRGASSSTLNLSLCCDGLHAFQKLRELRGRPKLRNRIEFFERRREGVAETPHRARRKLLELWIKVEVVNPARQMFRRFE